jgi:Na+-translocating ferredoxin:NAD+ oxidoreductase RnfD subunit
MTLTTSLESGPEYNKIPITNLIFIALIPGVFALILFFGWGSLFNIAVSSIAALIFEALILKLRKRAVISHLKDHSTYSRSTSNISSPINSLVDTCDWSFF